jgi:hypothetical protein
MLNIRMLAYYDKGIQSHKTIGRLNYKKIQSVYWFDKMEFLKNLFWNYKQYKRKAGFKK